MEVNVQILAGAAITVFLALLFFGVVVLWDVALALRSVGDKIDKLEDNVDDDLMEIAHVMDRRSPGQSGGGTQLHLNGGTISSGPGSAESQPQQPPRATPEGDRRRHHPERQPPGPEVGPEPRQRPPEPERQAPAAADAEPEQPEERTGTESAGDADPEEETGANDEEGSDGEPDANDATSESDAEQERDESDDATEPHPRADASRGRFVTSPDRTAWYATPLDRAAVAEARSPIAGELTDGSERGIDEADVIAAGPAPSGESSVGDSADETESATAPRGVLRAGPVDERETGSDEASQSDDGRAPDSSGGADASSAAAGSTAELSFEGETASAPGSAPPEGEDGADTEGAVGPSTDPTVGEGARDERTTADEEPAGDPTVPLADEAGADPLEFDVGDEEDDVTLEEAVEAMNEDAPVPELSSHRFDVAAEMDGDRAVLEFAFDPDAVEITGSTKRLLRYQLRSFADRQSTPDGDVTIDRHRIVVEIGDDDGNAVTNWGEAVVTIVDRTLFLSDNSN